MNLDLFDPTPEEAGALEGGEAAPVDRERDAPPDGQEVGPGEETPEVWTVSQVNEAVRVLLEGTLPPLWVSGEVGSWKRAGSGHCYFTLKDEAAQLRCVMWRTEAARLPMDPEEGMRIRVFGQLTLYEARGDFQILARVVEGEEGEGLWKLAFEKLRARLEAEGLLAAERKRPLPSFPQTVGMVTSLTGAALHDVLTVLRRRAPWITVLVRGARVQGEGAARELAEAIRLLGESGAVEVLIVGRGGGSLEDLWAFNEEPVARAIANCPIPVVSAVGHEVDVTISDLVADLRAPTPSAAAEAVAPDKQELFRYLEVARHRLGRGLRKGVDRNRRAVADGWAGLRRAGRGLLGPRRRLLGETAAGLSREMKALLRRKRFGLQSLSGRMDALSPLSTLRRGYAVPLGPEGDVLRGVGDFVPGEWFDLRVVDGRVRCEPHEVRKDEVDLGRER